MAIDFIIYYYKINGMTIVDSLIILFQIVDPETSEISLFDVTYK